MRRRDPLKTVAGERQCDIVQEVRDTEGELGSDKLPLYLIALWRRLSACEVRLMKGQAKQAGQQDVGFCTQAALYLTCESALIKAEGDMWLVRDMKPACLFF